MKRYVALLSVLFLLTAVPADAAPGVKIRTAHRMAERWANHPEPTNHQVSKCWRRTPRAVKCRIVYHEAGIIEYDDNGTWTPTQGTTHEVVTVRRRKHWLVLTSNIFKGQMRQRG